MLEQLFNPANYYINFYSLPLALTSLFILFLGVYVLIENVKSTVNISFFISCLSVFVWLSGIALFYSTKNSELSIYFYLRYTFPGILGIGPSVYFLTTSILRVNKERKIIIIANYIIMLILCLLSFKENWLIIGEKTYFWGRYLLYGQLSYFILPAFFTMMIMSFVYLYLAVRKENESTEKY